MEKPDGIKSGYRLLLDVDMISDWRDDRHQCSVRQRGVLPGEIVQVMDQRQPCGGFGDRTGYGSAKRRLGYARLLSPHGQPMVVRHRERQDVRGARCRG